MGKGQGRSVSFHMWTFPQSVCFQEGSLPPILFTVISFPAFNILLQFLSTLSSRNLFVFVGVHLFHFFAVILVGFHRDLICSPGNSSMKFCIENKCIFYVIVLGQISHFIISEVMIDPCMRQLVQRKILRL